MLHPDTGDNVKSCTTGNALRASPVVHDARRTMAHLGEETLTSQPRLKLVESRKKLGRIQNQQIRYFVSVIEEHVAGKMAKTHW